MKPRAPQSVSTPAQARVVRRACELVGVQQLADRLDVSRATVQAWLAGSAPRPREFLTMLRLVRASDPGFHPLNDPEAC